MSLGKIDYFVYITEWRSAQNKYVAHLVMGPINNIHDLWLYANKLSKTWCRLLLVLCLFHYHSIVFYRLLFVCPIAFYYISLFFVAVGVFFIGPPYRHAGGDC